MLLFCLSHNFNNSLYSDYTQLHITPTAPQPNALVERQVLASEH